jgi:hypothetical protein
MHHFTSADNHFEKMEIAFARWRFWPPEARGEARGPVDSDCCGNGMLPIR